MRSTATFGLSAIMVLLLMLQVVGFGVYLSANARIDQSDQCFGYEVCP